MPEIVLIHPLDEGDLSDPVKSKLLAALLIQQNEKATLPLTIYSVNIDNTTQKVLLASRPYYKTLKKFPLYAIMPRYRNTKTNKEFKDRRFIIPDMSKEMADSTQRNRNYFNLRTLAIKNDQVVSIRAEKQDLVTLPYLETDFDRDQLTKPHYFPSLISSLNKLQTTYQLTPKIMDLHYKPPIAIKGLYDEDVENIVSTRRYCEGASLLEIPCIKLQSSEIILLLLRLWEALQRFQDSRDNEKEIVHRDIKPDNIIFDIERGENNIIVDFKIKIIDPEFLEDVNHRGREAWGTEGYVAREQCENRANQKSDNYSMVKTIESLGVINRLNLDQHHELIVANQELVQEDVAKRKTIKESNIITILSDMLNAALLQKSKSNVPTCSLSSQQTNLEQLLFGNYTVLNPNGTSERGYKGWQKASSLLDQNFCRTVISNRDRLNLIHFKKDYDELVKRRTHIKSIDKEVESILKSLQDNFDELDELHKVCEFYSIMPCITDKLISINAEITAAEKFICANEDKDYLKSNGENFLLLADRFNKQMNNAILQIERMLSDFYIDVNSDSLLKCLVDCHITWDKQKDILLPIMGIKKIRQYYEKEEVTLKDSGLKIKVLNKIWSYLTKYYQNTENISSNKKQILGQHQINCMQKIVDLCKQNIPDINILIKSINECFEKKSIFSIFNSTNPEWEKLEIQIKNELKINDKEPTSSLRSRFSHSRS